MQSLDMDMLSTQAPFAPVTVLDGASLVAVFRFLSAKELAVAALVSPAFRAAAVTNLLWIARTAQDFGIVLKTGANANPEAAKDVYSRLLKHSRQPRALPARAVATDGGCDDPQQTTYWVRRVYRRRRLLIWF